METKAKDLSHRTLEHLRVLFLELHQAGNMKECRRILDEMRRREGSLAEARVRYLETLQDLIGIVEEEEE